MSTETSHNTGVLNESYFYELEPSSYYLNGSSIFYERFTIGVDGTRNASHITKLATSRKILKIANWIKLLPSEYDRSAFFFCAFGERKKIYIYIATETIS